jgi:hypothetical protein
MDIIDPKREGSFPERATEPPGPKHPDGATGAADAEVSPDLDSHFSPAMSPEEDQEWEAWEEKLKHPLEEKLAYGKRIEDAGNEPPIGQEAEPSK